MACSDRDTDRFTDLDEVARIFRAFGEADEEWMRLVLRGYATGASTGVGPAPVRTTPMSAGARAATMRMARPGAATLGSTPIPADLQYRPPTPARGVPTGMGTVNIPAAPAPQLPWWKRVLTRDEGRGARLRLPKLRYVALSGFLLWVGCFPRPAGLETTTPSVTALMRMREDAAEAALRAGWVALRARRLGVEVRGHQPMSGRQVLGGDADRLARLAAVRTVVQVVLDAIHQDPRGHRCHDAEEEQSVALHCHSMSPGFGER